MGVLDMNNDEEKKLVDGIFSSAVDCLSGGPQRRHRLLLGVAPLERRRRAAAAGHAVPAQPAARESLCLQPNPALPACFAADEDRRLPQIQHALPMLRRGIGVHHSGALRALWPCCGAAAPGLRAVSNLLA